MPGFVSIQLVSGDDATAIVDPFYAQEGKKHRARKADLFFVAFLEGDVVGVCRYCLEQNTPLLRSMVVHAPLRSRKIGARILSRFAQYLDDNNLGPTYCIPYSHLDRFYGLAGFKVIKESDAPVFLQERIREYRGRSIDAFLIMRRD